jgi:hypothetical protein
MNNLIILNKETFDVIFDKNLAKNNNNNSKDFTQNFYSHIIELIKDLDQMNLNTTNSNSNATDYYILKLDNSKNVIYRKGKNKFAILIICDKKIIKKQSLIEMSRVYLEGFEKNYINNMNDHTLKKSTNFTNFKMKEFTMLAIEDITFKFIEILRKNKLYAKFIYFNYNPNVVSSISYKKSKMESTSVILYNSNKDYDKM